MKELLRVILPRGKGSDFMNLLDKNGASSITCFYGYGLSKGHIENMLHIDKIKKEIVMAILDEKDARVLLRELNKEIQKTNTAIAFTSPLEYRIEDEVKMNLEYVALYVIVDRHEGQKAVQIAQENGARGASLVHGRGSAKEVKSILFNMNIEEEKDLVIMLVKTELAEQIKNAIYEQMQLKDENKGIIYTLPVIEVRGLIDQQ